MAACPITMVLAWFLIAGSAGNYVANDCYGNVLSLTCKPGHRIKVIDDFFGFSSRGPMQEDQCRYRKGDCTVTNGRFTSVIHRYCEGKQTCRNFQVDRRFCGSNQTNYEQVEYQCIPDSDVTSLCSSAAYSVREGYLSTPGFPREYPPDRHCRCSLASSDPGARIRLEATHFIVKFDNPCKDWLQISVGKHQRRLCGAYRSTLRSQAFNLTFHSDEKDGHQGIWLHFSLKPEDKNATIKVQCSSIPWPEVTTTTAAPTTTTKSTTPEETTTTIMTTPMTSSTTTEPVTSTKTTWYPTPDPTPPAPGDADRGPVSLSTPQYPEVTSQGAPSGPSGESEAGWRPDDGNDPLRAIAESKNAIRRKNNRITGIIIISICVGGIILLIVVLSVLLCINKRRQPKRQAEKERKKRLQQRLNSLSFYDSIPLYDSIGRKTGVVVAQQGNENETIVPAPDQNGGTAKPAGSASTAAPPTATGDGQLLDPQRLEWPRLGEAARPGPEPGPRLVPAPGVGVGLDRGEAEGAGDREEEEEEDDGVGAVEVDGDADNSDHESIICSKIGKVGRGGADAGAVGAANKGLPVPAPNGEGPPGYSLHLGVDKNEDIYTHV